ncbi:MAG: hypothetical protein K8S27_15830 [Candidatus Omnitrophica bacterium]|nr:hypothetical protein [Candidatus Omnitrophota bacterium]
MMKIASNLNPEPYPVELNNHHIQKNHGGVLRKIMAYGAKILSQITGEEKMRRKTNLIGLTIMIIMLLLGLFISPYSNAIAKEINALNFLSFEINNTASIQKLPLENNEVYSIIIIDDTTKFMSSLNIKRYSQKEISEYNFEDFKELIPQQYGENFISFISLEEVYSNGNSVDILIFDSYSEGIKMRSKWCILVYKKYFIHFATQTLEEFFENNSKTLDKIIASLRLNQD